MSRAMKNSGIPWIGEVPSHWEFYRIKYNTFLKGRIGWQGLNSNDFLDEGYCLITGTDFDNMGGIHWETCYRISKERFDEDELLHVKEGDLIMTKDGTVGKMAFIKHLPEEASLNSHLLIIRQLSSFISNSFLYWVMVSDIFKGFTGIYQTGTIMSSISQSTLGYFSCYCPSISEQQAIADFLDKKCSEIDEMVALQEKIVEELKAYKLSVITEAVTKGLNPDVKMKDSGAEWIGMIPQGWIIKRLKFSCQVFGRIGFRGYTTDDIVAEGEGAITISPSNMKELNMDFSKRTYLSWAKYLESPEIMISSGDVLMVKTGSSYGKCSYVDSLPRESTINPQIVVFKNHKDNAKYLAYYFQTPMAMSFIKTSVVGGTIPTIAQEKIMNYPFAFPPLEEQNTIVAYLDEKCSEINTLISVREAKIEALKEYKKSIIYECVTGKKEVQ